MIGFTLSEQQKLLQKEAAAIAKEVLVGARDVYSQHPDQLTRFRSTLPLFRQLVKAGLVKAQVPTALGGSCDNFIDSAITLEELYKEDPSLMVHVVGSGLGLLPLLLGGTPEQHKKYLEPFITCEGEPLCSLQHSEPDGTANWLEKGGKGLQVTARPEGDFYIVNGEKYWTTNSGGWDGKGATLSCLCCRYSETGGPLRADEDPAENVLILLVTRDVIADNEPEAYQILSEPELMGHPAASGPHTRYTNFKVPAANVLGTREKGAGLVENSFAVSAALVGTMATSVMRKAFEEALRFAKEDTRGGSVPLIERQSVADILISLKTKIDTSRIMVWKALDALENGPGDWSARLEQCLETKIYCTEQAVPGITEAMSVVGMTSYGKKTIFPRLLNDAMVLPLFDGGNVGVRRRQMQKLMQAPDYNPWAGVYD
ncbi:hypothetical protein LTR10_016066 [Elasticomyces elasticus]|uniref:Acyl-CoA dehydrogenase n=1 Tax=Exophiala sideris TaxID=1016849 RepID=A0ABR0J1V9_9EURO|nr:hypothetical protein LTR10_016066 [Elasticomyces elasticus]KAK5024597.1 hypothetical protein LTS07_008443 [Exophiala sideris]KAK5030691.1 hypothetical protein LTR13_008045 [Exophiala sideris]KAK5054230.1 hypothetical protein LTR69_008845 [Exophiala sideris]KAK5179632.1 hypothetical protein LTR44_007800 [Eurotiomycetes sp. CCFEE 6388]